MFLCINCGNNIKSRNQQINKSTNQQLHTHCKKI